MLEETEKDSPARPDSPAWLAFLAASTFAGLVLLSSLSIRSAFGGDSGPPDSTDQTPGAKTETRPEAEREAEPDSPRSLQESSHQQTPERCRPQRVLVADTGRFPVAKLRPEPGFEVEHSATVERGTELTVCELASTPGKNIPNRWFRVSTGRYTGRWIHEGILEFR